VSLPPRLLLLLALLPGLLLSPSGSLRICLRALPGMSEACAGMSASLPSCCPQPLPEGPIALPLSCCEGCCIAIAGQSGERSLPPSGGELLALPGLALPPLRAVAILPPTPRSLPPGAWPNALGPPPGRAPTPLRI
jgi:hypothetical protein